MRLVQAICPVLSGLQLWDDNRLPLLLAIKLGFIQSGCPKSLISVLDDARSGRVDFLIENLHVWARCLDIWRAISVIVRHHMGLDIGASNKVWFAYSRRGIRKVGELRRAAQEWRKKSIPDTEPISLIARLATVQLHNAVDRRSRPSFLSKTYRTTSPTVHRIVPRLLGLEALLLDFIIRSAPSGAWLLSGTVIISRPRRQRGCRSLRVRRAENWKLASRVQFNEDRR